MGKIIHLDNRESLLAMVEYLHELVERGDVHAMGVALQLLDGHIATMWKLGRGGDHFILMGAVTQLHHRLLMEPS